MSRDVIFIGGVGKPGVYGGELTKNKFIIKRLTEEGYNVKVIDTFGSHRNPFKIIHLPFVVIRRIATPVVFSSRFSNIRLLSKLIRLLNKKRLIAFFVTGGRLGREISGGVYPASDLKVFDHIIVESPSMASQLQDSGVSSVRFLPNFKDGSFAHFDGSKIRDLDSELRCVFFSRIDDEKGAGLILDVLDDIKDSGRNIKIDFFGDIRDSFKDRFLNSISVHSWVRYCGRLNMSDGSGQKVLSRYHLFLFPTYFPGEGFPGVVVDALMSGVPILSSDWNFNPEFVTPEVGFLSKTKSLDDFRRKLFEIYDNRSMLVEYFDRCEVESRKYDINNLLTSDLFHDVLSK